MTLTREEFNVILMLYAARIDGNVRKEEVEKILEYTNSDVFKKVEKSFVKMSDMEVLECICKNKAEYASTDSARIIIIRDLRDIIEADEKVTAVEEHLLRTIQRLLK